MALASAKSGFEVSKLLLHTDRKANDISTHTHTIRVLSHIAFQKHPQPNLVGLPPSLHLLHNAAIELLCISPSFKAFVLLAMAPSTFASAAAGNNNSDPSRQSNSGEW